LGENLIDQITPEVPELPAKPTLNDKVTALYKANKLHERIRLFDDKAYFAVIVFKSREQVRAFVEAMGWLQGNGKEAHWLDGCLIAQKEGIKLPYVNEELLHESYSKRKDNINWPEGLQFFDETKPQ
jgi:hypothetical protein